MRLAPESAGADSVDDSARSAQLSAAMRRDERLMYAVHPVFYPLLSAVPGPVTRIPRVGVVVKEAGLAREVLLDGAGFSKHGPGVSSDLWTPVLGRPAIVSMHGEEHRRMRSVLAPLFAPSFVDPLVERTLGSAAAQIASRLVRGERVDLALYARRAASAVIALLLGIKSDVVDESLLRRVTEITGMVRLTRPRLKTAQAARARSVIDDLSVHTSRSYRGDDTTVPGKMRALGLDEETALAAAGAFILTGTETMIAALPRIAALLIDSGTLSQAREPQGLERAISEGLRWTTPTPVMLRAVLEPRAIGSVSVAPGERVVIATYAANRRSGGFDPAGEGAAGLKKLWFGAGSHFCIGAPMAMAQLRLGLGVLAAAEQASGGLRIASRRAARKGLLAGYTSCVIEAR